jgi:hypothetical protein
MRNANGTAPEGNTVITAAVVTVIFSRAGVQLKGLIYRLLENGTFSRERRSSSPCVFSLHVTAFLYAHNE